MNEQVGVLVPLQLETVFTSSEGGASWTVRVRVIPQPPSIDSHEDHVSDAELTAVVDFRAAIGRTGALSPTWFGTERHRAAFLALAGRVGAARAAWLAATVRTRRVGRTITATRPGPATDAPRSVRGLPPQVRVEVWPMGGPAMTLGVLPVGGGRIPTELPLPELDQPGSVTAHWLTDWDAAVAVGLAGEFPLPDGLGPTDLGGLAVFGLGDAAPDQVWQRHVVSGELAIAALGAATTSVDGEPTLTSTTTRAGDPCPTGSPDATDWWQALLRRLDGGSTALDDAVRHVGGPALPSLATPRAAAGDDLAHLVVRALWPTLWGDAALVAWGLPPDVVGRLTRWALTQVAPEGPLPSLRLGEEPYALLPLTRLDTWSPAADDPAELAALVGTLTGLRRDLHARLLDTGTVRGASPERHTDLTGRGGASRSFAWRRSARASAIISASGPVGRALDQRRRHLDAHGLTDPTADPFLELSAGAEAIELPLVQPRWSTVWGDDRVFHRVPFPALVDTLLGRGTTLTPLAGGPLTGLAGLFARDARFAGETREGPQRWRLGGLPDSLLARLLVQACLTVNAWRTAPTGDLTRALADGFDDGDWQDAALTLATLLEPPPTDAPWEDSPHWEFIDPDQHLPRLLPGQPFPAVPAPPIDGALRARLERALGATLDSVSTRIDPWLTAVAWQRLREASPTATRRLGAYGWVHGPFEGEPGPTASGLLHTPSQGQTLVATLARDQFLHHARAGLTNEDGTTPWGLALTGAATRVATDLAADLRNGHHLHEVVGREAERILAAPAPAPYTAAGWLRTEFPLQPHRPDPRQVCDGVRVLEAYLDGEPPTEVPASAAQLGELAELRAGLDALTDLALLDGALASASRRPGVAAGAMDAIAGTGPMTEPAYPRTPATGRDLRTTVWSVVPWRDPAPGATASGLADPSVAALLADQLGTTWVWRVARPGQPPTTITLDALGLAPVDTLALSADQLRSFVAAAAGAPWTPTVTEHENRRWEVQVGGVTRALADGSPASITLTETGLDPAAAPTMPEPDLTRQVLRRFFAPGRVRARSTLQPVPVEAADGPPGRVWALRDPSGGVLAVHDRHTLGLSDAEARLPWPDVAATVLERAGMAAPTITDPPEHAQAARLVALLGRPAAAHDLPGTDRTPDPGVHAELRERYRALHADLGATIAELRAAAKVGATDATRVAAVRRGVRWAATPTLSAADAVGLAALVAGVATPPGATAPRMICRLLATALAARRTAAPRPTGIPAAPATGDPTALRAKGRPEGTASIARALSALACPDGNLPVLTGWSTQRLVGDAGLSPVDRAVIEQDWLTVVAPVRPALARLEAHQLAADARGGAGLALWANADDPWLKDAVSAHVSTDRGTSRTPMPTWCCAVGPAGALDGARVAVGVLDAYTEVLPLTVRDTHAAFGFNAPQSRAPQAILLAVPPTAGGALTDDDLSAMLAELRELVVARSATMADRVDDSLLTRTAWLPADQGPGLFAPAAAYVGR